MSGKKHLRGQLSKLRANYKELFTVEMEDWDRIVEAYLDKLRKVDAVDVEAAVEAAMTKHPDKMPTVPQLASIAADCTRRRHDEARRRSAEDREAAENAIIRDYVAEKRRQVIPDTPEGQNAWINAGDTEAEKIARYFEAQSKHLNLDPIKPCPPEVHHERMRLFAGLVGAEFIEVPADQGAAGEEAA